MVCCGDNAPSSSSGCGTSASVSSESAAASAPLSSVPVASPSTVTTAPAGLAVSASPMVAPPMSAASPAGAVVKMPEISAAPQVATPHDVRARDMAITEGDMAKAMAMLYTAQDRSAGAVLAVLLETDQDCEWAKRRREVMSAADKARAVAAIARIGWKVVSWSVPYEWLVKASQKGVNRGDILFHVPVDAQHGGAAASRSWSTLASESVAARAPNSLVDIPILETKDQARLRWWIPHEAEAFTAALVRELHRTNGHK